MEKDIQMVNKHMKKSSTLFAIMKMRIKTTMIYNYIFYKKQKMPNTGEDAK